MPRRKPHRSSRSQPPSPTRAQLIQSEAGALDTGHGPLSVALVYPNSYSVGMASLGYQEARRVLIESGAARVERAFVLPLADEERTLFQRKMATFETNTPLGEFDIIAFSVAYELDYLHVLEALDRSGMPLFASRRGAGWPLVVAGGPALGVNPAGLEPFVDLFTSGAAEPAIATLLAAVDTSPRFRKKPSHRAALLSSVSGNAGTPPLSPTLGALHAVGAAPQDLADQLTAFESAMEGGVDEATDFLRDHPDGSAACQANAREENTDQPRETPPPATSHIVTPFAQFGQRVLIEIARGCPNRCTFCWVGHQHGRFTPSSADTILEASEAAAEATGCDSVGLIASAVGAHPEIEAICEGLLARGRNISFSSLRAEDVKPIMIEALVRSGQRGLTLAPEAGTLDLRRTLGKALDNEGFLEVVANAQRAGLANLKLYFMVGLPDETDAATDAIVEFAQRAQEVLVTFGRERGHVGSLSINLGIYVPKPGTPLSRRPHPSFADTRRRARSVTRALQALPNVRVAAPSPHLAAAQEILSTGTAEAAALTHAAWKAGENWRQTVKKFQR